MTDFSKGPEDIVEDLINLLVDRYESGFAIFKELLQNADDAGANRMLVAVHDGFAEARNPLLQAPSLIIVNDGPVLAKDFEALKKASGGGKADEAGKVGRFGLGQKSVFHFCDAFVCLAWIEGEQGDPKLDILNPFEQIANAEEAGKAWKHVHQTDADILATWVKHEGFSSGMVLQLPLRSERLSPGGGLQITKERWTPAEAVTDIAREGELIPAMACLRHLRTVEIENGKNRLTYSVSPNPNALASPNDPPSDTVLGGEISRKDQPIARIFGNQCWKQDGEAMALKDDPDWPFRVMLNGTREPEKAAPHGAVIAVHAAGAASNRLRLHHAVYLPVGGPIAVGALPHGAGEIDILLHGCLFPSSDRKRILLGSETRIHDRWNELLLREATYPLLLDAVAQLLPELAEESHRYSVIRTLADLPWWSEHSGTACGERALANVWNGTGKPQWQVVEASQLRPLPIGDSTHQQHLKAVWPELATWAEKKGLLFCFGTALTQRPPLWSDLELSELVTEAGVATFTRPKVADTVHAVLSAADNAVGDLTRIALAELFRSALKGDDDFAPADRVRRLVEFLPPELLFTLPKSVEKRSILAALAKASSMLPLREEWVLVPQHPALNTSDTIALLSALEPLLDESSLEEQTSTAITGILRLGPSLSELAANERSRNLAVITASRLSDRERCRLTLTEMELCAREGRLFGRQPVPGLEDLAQAVIEPEIYRVNWRAEEGFIKTGSKQSDLVQVLKIAKQFGDPQSCGKLAARLHEQAGSDELRRLVAMRSSLPSTSRLLEVGTLASVLAPLADQLREQHPDDVVILPLVADSLSRQAKEKIGIRAIDAPMLGVWLIDALENERWPLIGDAVAEALLVSQIDDSLLAQLPLNKTTNGEWCASNDRLYFANPGDVPSTLSNYARIVAPWPDNAVQRVQRRLIAHWSGEAQIETALSAPLPHLYATEIIDALIKKPALPASLLERLRETPWLPIGDTGASPTEVLNLPESLCLALGEAIGEERPLATLHDLPGALQEDQVLAVLGQFELLLDEGESLDLAGMMANEAGVAGVAADYIANFASWRDISRAGHSLDTPGWPAVCAALALPSDPSTIDRFIRQLKAPTLDDALLQLNGLAQLVLSSPPQTEGDAARRLHREIFDCWQGDILRNGFLPPDLLVPSRSGSMRPASELALDAQGVQPSALLDLHYLKSLNSEDAVIHDESLPRREGQDFHLRLREELERFRDHSIPAEAILFLLAMLGRDKKTATIAADWEEQRPFDRICDELDDIATTIGLPKDEITERVNELRFEIRSSSTGEIPVRSASGGVVVVPLEGNDSWLIDCIKLESRREDGKLLHPYSLSLAPVEIADADHAKRLLEAFVERVAPALTLGMPHQRLALLERFKLYFTDDQASLEEACKDLKRVIDDRLQGIKPGTRVRQALSEFHRRRHREPEQATDALWEFLGSDAAADELLAAVRQKIREMGYASERVLFELFQNADDAHDNWYGLVPGRFTVTAWRNPEGDIARLHITHWGRPINHLGANSDQGRELGYGNDLANMLAINHSAKEGERQTGQFGLGFKTVHMLANEVGVASGRQIVARIRGGMIPIPWENGSASTQPYRIQGQTTTLFELPISPEASADAELAFNAFVDASPWLAAIAPRIGKIEIQEFDTVDPDDGRTAPRSYGAKRNDLAEGLTVIELSTGRKVLEILLIEGFRLFIALGKSGPDFIRDARQFWHLVPLDGIERRGAWVMEGRFPVDPGRTHLSGSIETQRNLFERIGWSLGERLIQLYDILETGWHSFAAQQGLDLEGRDEFWQRLVNLFRLDVDGFGPEAELHFKERGLGRVLTERPLVRLANGGSAVAGDVTARLVGALRTDEVLDLVRAWPAFLERQSSLVGDDEAALLRSLKLRDLHSVSLVSLAADMIDGARIDPDLAEKFGLLVAASILEFIDKEEEREFRALLSSNNWLAEDGSWQPIRYLAFPEGSQEAERLRAAFAPPENRLSSTYGSLARDTAEFGRALAGQNEEVYKAWISTAGREEARALAALRYLAMADERSTNVLAQAATWLPKGRDLQNFPLLAQLDGHTRAVLLAKLGATIIPSSPVPLVSIDAAQALDAIAEWWEREGTELSARYDRAVYPEGFRPTLLSEDDDEAWFTMLALATFHTLGRIKPDQSKSFVEQARRDGWWRDLAIIQRTDDLTPFADLLRRWTEPAQNQPLFWLWRRCLPDLCMIARYLEEYRRFFRKLPQVLTAHPKISLRSELQPATSQIWARFGMNAGPVAQSMGIGANWTLRELVRHGIYNAEQAQRTEPLSWSTGARVRRLFEDLGLGPIEHGIDAGRLLHSEVVELIGLEEARFGGDGDLPLHIVTTARHRGTLQRILSDATGAEWRNADYDDGEGSYDI